ncbi:hypothetical protein HJC23_012053 [Cyclotella cryptica]|uniref:Uncharacterized protein n=1 Tax=Cyclotella cryptica TaxID=29204 RepID=A0ABD3NX66_9STRA|eukprot:CCRYP_019332-RA/>CCRYP_019332-RA protein AED:0.28 eAED:0.28 QI:0/-1/0/1/-1/1/1/0/204
MDRFSQNNQPPTTGCSKKVVSEGARRLETADTKAQFQGNALLEEWPHRVSYIDSDDISLCMRDTRKEVSFSQYSSLHVYPVHEVENNKSFKNSERRVFQAQAVYEACRIQDLISSCPYEGGKAIRYLTDRNLLKTEEMLGIESMLAGAERVLKDRLKHTAFVLDKQRELKGKNDVNIAEELAKAAINRSQKNSEKARLRAALAT